MSDQEFSPTQPNRSVPGKLAAWLWERTPAGRAAVQREHMRNLAEEQSRIAERDQEVRALLLQVDTPRDFAETLAELATRREALRHTDNLAELRALRSAYDSWMADVEDLIGTREKKQTRAESAHQQMELLRATMQRTGQFITPAQQAQCDRLEARLAELDASAAKLVRLWHTAQDRQVWLHQLGTAYRSLAAEAQALAQTMRAEA